MMVSRPRPVTAQAEYKKAGMEMSEAAMNLFLLYSFFFLKYSMISEREENR